MAKKVKFDQEAAFKAIIGMNEPLEGQVTGEEIVKNDATVKENETNVPKTEAAPKKKGGGRPKMNKEKKERKTFTILPSLYEEASEVAYKQGKNMSELVSELLNEYVEKYR